MAWTIIKGPLEAVIGICYGITLGILMWYIPHRKHVSLRKKQFSVFLCHIESYIALDSIGYYLADFFIFSKNLFRVDCKCTICCICQMSHFTEILTVWATVRRNAATVRTLVKHHITLMHLRHHCVLDAKCLSPSLINLGTCNFRQRLYFVTNLTVCNLSC